MWDVLQPQVIAFAFTLLSSLILWLVAPSIKLVWGVSHKFFHRLRHDGGEIGVPTATVVVQNEGRGRATDVEVVFNWPVRTYSVWPQRAYRVAENPEGRWSLSFADLGPKEHFQIHLIEVDNELPDVLTVRCAEAVGKQVPVAPMRIFPPRVYWAIRFLIFAGVFAIIYVAALAVMRILAL
jgi:hypothetical protein